MSDRLGGFGAASSWQDNYRSHTNFYYRQTYQRQEVSPTPVYPSAIRAICLCGKMLNPPFICLFFASWLPGLFCKLLTLTWSTVYRTPWRVFKVLFWFDLLFTVLVLVPDDDNKIRCQKKEGEKTRRSFRATLRIKNMRTRIKS